MTSVHKRRIATSIVALFVFISLCVWFIMRVRPVINPLPATDKAGNPPIPEIAAEFGPFADLSYKPAVTRYLLNLDAYRELPLQNAPKNVDSKQIVAMLAPRFQALIDADRSNSRIAKAQGPKLVESLVSQVSLLLGRCCGISSAEYLSRLREDAVLHLPDNPELLDYTLMTFLPGTTKPSPQPAATETRGLFTKLFDLDSNFRSDSNEVVGWASGPMGLVVAITEQPRSAAFADLVFDHLSAKDRDFYFGSISQGSLIFTNDADNLLNTGDVFRAEVIIVVKTLGNDFYPIIFGLQYEPDKSRWDLRFANRQCSPRMASSPPLVF